MMDITHPKLLSLLHQVKQIRQEYELTARITGENFNVFTILGLSTAEVRTHSAFLAELLNTKGSHGQGSIYLKLFLQRVDIGSDVFTDDGASAKVEHYIGPVDLHNGLGGQIDILITDSVGRHIVIENKIYAGDQEQQLVRYYSFDPKATLLYLTLNGKKPDERSCKGLDLKCIKFVSYEDHILDWLDECLKASVSLPIIRETIIQYVYLIRMLTGKTKEKQVTEQAKKLILENPDLIDSVVVLGEAWQSIRNNIRECFEKGVRSAINREFDLGNGVKLQRRTPTDCGGFCVAFRVIQAVSDKPIADTCRYSDALRAYTPSFGRSNCWNVGWYNPKRFGPGRSVETLPGPEMITFLLKEGKMKVLVADVIEEAERITAQLRAALGEV